MSGVGFASSLLKRKKRKGDKRWKWVSLF
jgi:hypothetical protein